MDIIIPEFATLVAISREGGLGYLHELGERVVIHEHVVEAAKESADLGRSLASLADWIKNRTADPSGKTLLVEKLAARRNTGRTMEKAVPVGAVDPQKLQQEAEVVQWFRERVRALREPALVMYTDRDVAKAISEEHVALDPGEAAFWHFDTLGDYLMQRSLERDYFRSVAQVYAAMCRKVWVGAHTRTWA